MGTVMKRIAQHYRLLTAFFAYIWLVNLQNTDSYYGVYVLIAVCALYTAVQPAPVDKRCSLVAALFSGAVVLANYGLFSPWSALLNLCNGGCTLLGGWFVFYPILSCALEKLPIPLDAQERTHPHAVFFGSFVIVSAVFLCYLFFHSYPGLLSRDSFSTVRQILNGDYNNTMPFWHTMTVELFFRIGYTVFGEINAAIAFYMVVQVLFMAACFAYTVMTLYQAGIPLWIVCLVLAGYALLPYHVVYSVTLWKDVLFGGAALLMVTALLRILKQVGRNSLWNEILFVLGGIGLSLWRTNGWYALAATTLILALLVRKQYRRLLCLLLGVLLICWVLISPVLNSLGVPGTDFVEALGIPFQQISRVVAADCPLTEEETHQLSQVFDLELVKEKYDPQTVDPIKFETFHGYTVLKENLFAYAALWLRLGLRYPSHYLQAWVETTKGYWNGGYEYWIYMYHQEGNDLGIRAADSQNPVASAFRALFRYLEKPDVLKPLYSIGLQVWLMLICCLLCIWKGREEFIITIPILVIVAGLWIGTPVFAEFRYAYPVFTTAPLILCATAFDRNQKLG